MAIYKVINTTSTKEPNYEMIVSLDGTNYVLVFDWIQRWGRWTISVLTENRQPILMGHGLVTNYPVGVRVKDSRMWPGLMVVISDGSHTEPNLENMNLKGPIQLAYRPVSGNS